MTDNSAFHNEQCIRIKLVFAGNLRHLLPRKYGGRHIIEHDLERRASIKDVAESFGVPHTEIGALRVNGNPVPFTYIVEDKDTIEIEPGRPPVDIFQPTLLRPAPLNAVKFAVDTNVGKLARLLRMSGFDTFFENDCPDDRLADIADREARIVLTRDRKLLHRKNIIHGHLIRECNPARQLREVIHFFGLLDELVPFSRCMHCNSLLEPVAKEEIIDRLEPLTKKYYNEFHICPGCKKIYWPGSHKEKMEKILKPIAAKT